MKIVLIFLCTFLAPCCSVVEPSCLNELGDVNGNGIHDASDAAIILDISLELISPSQCQFVTADVDEDGVVTNTDAEIVFEWAVSE